MGIGWRHAHYRALLEQLPPLDFIEVHSENFFAAGGAALAVLLQGRQHYPVSLHGVGLALGSAVGIDPWHLDQLARLVDQIEPILVSDHACFARGHVAGQPVHAADLLPIPFNNASLDVLCANVQRVQERLKRPLLVENLSAYISYGSSDCSETDFLNALVQRTGCGLLVDVNNIYVNALNDQIADQQRHQEHHSDPHFSDPLESCLRWIDAIAPDSVGELHLAGHINLGDVVVDDHGSRVCAPVWQIYRHAQTRFGRPARVPALIEWDTDVPPLAVLLDEAALAKSA